MGNLCKKHIIILEQFMAFIASVTSRAGDAESSVTLFPFTLLFVPQLL